MGIDVVPRHPDGLGPGIAGVCSANDLPSRLRWPGLLYGVALALFVVASAGIYADCRWAWIISVAFLLGYWILRGWLAWANFVINSYMFLTGHELYRDSPGTILVVAIYAVFGIFPATGLLILGAISSGHILAVLRGRHPLVSAESTPKDA